MIKKSLLIIISASASLSACAMFTKTPKPLGISGSFNLQMDTSAAYNKEITSFPVSGHIVEQTPFINNTFLAPGLPLFGIYKNTGYSCSIIWTTLTFSDGSTMNNSNGVAKSSCYPHTPITESSIIKVTWN